MGLSNFIYYMCRALHNLEERMKSKEIIKKGEGE